MLQHAQHLRLQGDSYKEKREKKAHLAEGRSLFDPHFPRVSSQQQRCLTKPSAAELQPTARIAMGKRKPKNKAKAKAKNKVSLSLSHPSLSSSSFPRCPSYLPMTQCNRSTAPTVPDLPRITALTRCLIFS